MADRQTILLKTKLNRPPITQDLIDRPLLFDQLNRGIHAPLTLVIASAGFGKSTLISTWLDSMSKGRFDPSVTLPAAWLSLDEGDSDLNLFLRYFIAALRTIFPHACKKTLALLLARQPTPQSVLYANLSNEIEQLAQDFILVLDDYHSIQSAEIHALLTEFTRHWPAPLHLVLISRISPPLPLAGPRAKGRLSEIRTSDLRFTVEETATYLNRSHLVLLSRSVLQLLEERFEGWIAGLKLAAISLRSEGSQDAVLAGLSTENVNITAYLADEVLIHQFPAIQTFLIKTSILDRFCIPLCEAVIGESDPAWNARACLDWIERSELFIVPLDNRREWYRYHHLFKDLMQQRLIAETAPDSITHLHRLASAWFETQGLLDEALHHTLATGDYDLAARQMNAGLRDVINREDWPTLERWLRLLPEEIINQHPELLMIRVWLFELIWRLDLQAQVIAQAEAILTPEAGELVLPLEDLQILRGQINMIKSQQMYFTNRPEQAIEFGHQALAQLPPSWTFARGAAMLYLGLAMLAGGEAPQAERMLLDAYEFCLDKSDIYPLILLQALGYIYLWTGRHEDAWRTAQLLIQSAASRDITIMKNWGDYYAAMVSYQRNELETAAQYFTRITENRYISHGAAYRDAISGLALIHYINGEFSAAWQMVETISRYDLDQSGSEDNQTRSLRARLLLLEGNLEGAGQWADTITGPPPDQPLIWFEEPQVTRVRVLIARGAADDLEVAHRLLDSLEEITDRTRNTRYKIEILALRALAFAAQGQSGQAGSQLQRALDLARPGGFIRLFTDLGRPMQALLLKLANEDRTSAIIPRILATFPGNGKNPLEAASPDLYAPNLVEPLTHRELEILELLRGPLSVKEIAFKLNISYATARRHSINIYAKLGVNCRRDAVAKAVDSKVLPPQN